MIFWLGWLLFAFVLIWTVPSIVAMFLKQLGATRRLSVQSLPEQSLVSVIVPARNEAEQIERALKSLLATEDISIELITVNDRSTDATGEIMDVVAAADARVRVLHLERLPPGWLGKNNAMHQGAAFAKGDLLLFTDGDVVFEPGAIARAAEFLRTNNLQHLSMLPRMIPGNTLENAVTAFFGLSFAVGMQLCLIRTRWPFSYAGVGAFNLIDASYYHQIGGHTPIAMDVLDDVKLGKMVKKNGGRQDFLNAPELLSIRWQPSLWGVVTGLEKNGFAALNYSLLQIGLVTLLFFATMISPYVMMVMAATGVLSWPQVAGFLATIVIWHACYGAAARLSGGGVTLFPLFPFAALMMAFAFWRSAWVTLRQGGVRWRDSFYPLSELKSAIFR